MEPDQGKRVDDPSALEHPGTLIGGRYRITGRIGEGGMGIVHRAVDEQLHRPVAIKFLPPALRGDADRLARFKNEARALSALTHPHIITIYEVGDAGDAPFIAMEMVEGQTLRERLRSGRLPLRAAVDVCLQVARALGAAHEKRIVHRDIKPENVMIRGDGYVKVLDFGLAGLRAPLDSDQSVVTNDSFATIAAAVTGTPAYMSPEQIEGAPIDARSDVFSLGVLLCEAVTGINPFARPGVMATMSAIGQTPAPAARVTGDLPPAIGAVVIKALQKDPAARYQTSADLAADLQRILTGLDVPPADGLRSRSRYAAVALTMVVAAGAGGIAYRRSERRIWVREQAIPDIARLANQEKSAAAFATIQAAERYLPEDPDLARAAAAATRVASIRSSPPGAVVEVKDYLFPDEGWLRLGTTPLESVRIPNGYLRWRVSKAGVGESITAPPPLKTLNFDLQGAVDAPQGMVPVARRKWGDYLAFLGWLGPFDLPPFFIDRFEVTNREYQEFVDKGGYAKREYWKQTFTRDGQEVSWAAAMDLFRDPTGRPGPSTWDGGHYPEGKGAYPVTGVSWYEAAAYAEFSGKSLPVIAQWGETAPVELDKFILPLSNLSETVAAAGTSRGLGPYGTYDLVGNVREWYWNAGGDNLRFLLGREAGSYGPEALPPFDRSSLNGFRCVRNSVPLAADLTAARPLLHRDFSTVKAAGDDVFRVYRNIYAYDKRPFPATVEAVPDAAKEWKKEKVTLDTAYGNERMAAFLFLPKNAQPPFQTVVFFPSARVNDLPSSDALGDVSFFDYVVKSGRAVMYPIYQGLYERRKALPVRPGPTTERETTVDWSKDLGRSIDYLETRSDIDTTRVGFLGVSQGTAYGVILAALEDRLKAVVLLDGGFFQAEHPVPGMDQVDFAPRLTKPTLMVNGRYDATFPLESSQQPLFRMLGATSEHKRHVVFDTPHDVRLRSGDLVREVLAWYDKYLGRVN
jgi:formylglycine-generating enzyme required for sulfatase activity/dienelactone hydrolase